MEDRKMILSILGWSKSEVVSAKVRAKWFCAKFGTKTSQTRAVFAGVYQHHGGKMDGGHAVKLIGWGVDKIRGKDVPYWLVVNSWNKDWGVNGKNDVL